MTTSTSKAINLDKFLLLPEGKPVQEYINGKIIYKPTAQVGNVPLFEQYLLVK